MSLSATSESVTAPRSLMIAAFAAIYVFWGSTFLGIKFAIETIPPFLMAGTRFLVAGLLMYGLARLRHRELPTWRHWRNAAVVGCLLLAVGNGSVTYVEQTLPTVLAALVISMTPVSMVVIDWLRGGPRPGAVTQLGLVLGVIGVVSIAAPTGGETLSRNHISSIAILVAATLAWSYGSVWSRQAEKPRSPFLTVGMQMIAAGLALLLFGLACGEARQFDPASLSRKSVLAWVYLVLAGSVIGFTAYIWLLQVTTTARVATHSYVNPVIAVVLGLWLGNESLSGSAAVGGALVVSAVVLILRPPRHGGGMDVLRPPGLPGSPGGGAPVVER